MRPRSVIAWLSLILFTQQAVAGDVPLNDAIAQTPKTTVVSIVKTDRIMNGGSVVNDLRFSDGRIYTLSLDFPFDLATDKVIHADIHFTIYLPGAWERRETLEHGSAAEKRLIELLQQLVITTRDPHEKKNATTLTRFLKDRRQGFPMGRKWWDFTPWTVE
jgi:hypothetical protein